MSNPIVVERKTKYTDGREGVRHCHWCPGCDALHRERPLDFRASR